MLPKTAKEFEVSIHNVDRSRGSKPSTQIYKVTCCSVIVTSATKKRLAIKLMRIEAVP